MYPVDDIISALENCLREPRCQDCNWKECEDPYCHRAELPYNLAYAALELIRQPAFRQMLNKIADMHRGV